MPAKQKAIFPVILALTFLFPTGCNFNVFDPLDSPSGDAQLLSAARKCFDEGNFECANEYYSQLSSDQAEIKASESAYVLLDQNGVGMKQFIAAFGSISNTDPGKAITKLATSIASGGGGDTTKRVNMYRALKKIDLITTNTQLKGLVQFLASVAFVAEVLAEKAGASSPILELTQADITVTPSTCLSAGTGGCAGAGSCAAVGSFGTNALSNSQLSLVAESEINSGSPTLNMIDAGIRDIQAGINGIGGALGGFSSSSFSFATQLLTFSLASPNCYRYGLLSLNIGKSD